MSSEAPTITYGNLAGTYFNQRTIDDVLVPLAPRIARAIPNATEFRIWYDPTQDFHHLSFVAGGKLFDVMVYKVFSLAIDGDRKWAGCPLWNEDRFLDYMVDALALAPSSPQAGKGEQRAG